MATNSWGADTPVSMPRPIPADQLHDVAVNMYGFRFTARGLQHDLTGSDVEAILSRRYAPLHHDEQRGDADLDDA